jgi:hypothetical protein
MRLSGVRAEHNHRRPLIVRPHRLPAHRPRLTQQAALRTRKHCVDFNRILARLGTLSRKAIPPGSRRARAEMSVRIRLRRGCPGATIQDVVNLKTLKTHVEVLSVA